MNYLSREGERGRGHFLGIPFVLPLKANVLMKNEVNRVLRVNISINLISLHSQQNWGEGIGGEGKGEGERAGEL